MKTPLSEIEQENLRTRGILKNSEFAYKEGNLTFAEDALAGTKRVINVKNVVNEGKDILFG